MIEIGILHLPRPDRVPFLNRTIETLVAAGASTLTIYRDHVGEGATRNMISAWRDLGFSREKYIAVVDDDLVFAARALEIAYSTLDGMKYWPKESTWPALSMWTIEQNIPHDQRQLPGCVIMRPHKHLWGGAVVMKPKYARAVSETMATIMEQDESLATKPDACLYMALERLECSLLFHLPSLCDHIGGEHSTLGNDHSNGDTRGFRFNEW